MSGDRRVRVLQQRDRFGQAIALGVIRRQHGQCRFGAGVLGENVGQDFLGTGAVPLHCHDPRQVDLGRQEVGMLLGDGGEGGLCAGGVEIG